MLCVDTVPAFYSIYSKTAFAWSRAKIVCVMCHIMPVLPWRSACLPKRPPLAVFSPPRTCQLKHKSIRLLFLHFWVERRADKSRRVRRQIPINIRCQAVSPRSHPCWLHENEQQPQQRSPHKKQWSIVLVLTWCIGENIQKQQQNAGKAHDCCRDR